MDAIPLINDATTMIAGVIVAAVVVAIVALLIYGHLRDRPSRGRRGRRKRP